MMSLESEIEEMVKTLEPPMEKNLNTAVRTFFMSQDNESSLARCCHACPVCHAMCLKEYGHLDKHDGHHQPLGLAGISGMGFTFDSDQAFLGCPLRTVHIFAVLVHGLQRKSQHQVTNRGNFHFNHAMM